MRKKILYTILSLYIFNMLLINNLLAIKVSVSIKPLHSLVSMVTDNVLSPELIVKGRTSSHSIHLSAQNIKNINNSDLVFIASKHLEAPIYTAMINKNNLYEMINFQGLTILEFTKQDLIFKDVHHTEIDDNIDYHIWLDPKNAITILFKVANILSIKDPKNAKKYHFNAKKYSKKIENLHLELNKQFSAYKFPPYILYHNGFAYLENRYNLHHAGILQDSCDIASHITSNNFSNKKLFSLLEFIKNNNVSCVFLEPDVNNKVLINLLKKNNITYSIIDPIGYNLTIGKDLYFELLPNIFNAFKNCLANNIE